MAARRLQRQYAFVLSVLGHAAIVVALTFSIPLANRNRPVGSDVEPIETYMIDQAALDAEIARLEAEDAAERLRQDQEAERIREQQRAEQRELERIEREALEAERAAEQRRIQLEQEAEAEKLRIAERVEREEAERLERERQAERERQLEEQRRQEQLAREREEAARRQREAEELARRQAVEADIQRSIAAEQAARVARESGARDQWALAIGRRVEQYWNRPPSVDPNLECVLVVTQLPDGSVTQVTVERCTTTDQTIIRSVENAVLNASPLPQRPSGVPFERQIRITFRPAE